MGSTLSQSSVISTDGRLMRVDVLVLRTVPSHVVYTPKLLLPSKSVEGGLGSSTGDQGGA